MVANEANPPSAQIVRQEARELDRDRYLAALLAPASARQALMTIAAFHGEIARIPTSVREPAMGAIRLQWWRDALGEDATAGRTPLADSVRHAIANGALADAEVFSIIDSYETLLQPGALADPVAFDAFLDASQGAAFRLSARVLGNREGEFAALINAAAQSYGRVQLLRALPLLLAKGRNPLAMKTEVDWPTIVLRVAGQTRARLSEVRRLIPGTPVTLRTAILPVALVEPYLAALEGLGCGVASEQAEISPLSRVWRIYIARRLGRF